MKKFVAFYQAERSAIDGMRNAPPDSMQPVMDAWMKWYRDNAGAIADPGAPLGKTKRLDQSGLKDASNGITGYTVMQGESFEAVAKLFEGHPHLQYPGCSIDFLEVLPMPGG